MKVIEQDTLIGKRIAKLDAPEKASGKTRYIHDIDLPGSSTARSCARRASMRASCASTPSAAQALPGVHAVITAADVPDQRPIGVGKDHLPLKGDKVRSLRDEIAAVAADTEEIADAALQLIEVEYEDLPVAHRSAEALKPGAPLIHAEPHGAGAARRAQAGRARRRRARRTTSRCASTTRTATSPRARPSPTWSSRTASSCTT